MKKMCASSVVSVGTFGMAALCLTIFMSVTAAQAAGRANRILVITASNGTNGNMLLSYNTGGILVGAIPTGGKGGASGNAGGIATDDGLIAAVNFASDSVSLFSRGRKGVLELEEIVPTVSSPVSVALARDHLYVLGAKSVASYRLRHGHHGGPELDGSSDLVLGDGSAAQVGVTGEGLILTEKNNVVEVVDLRRGAVSGETVAVKLPDGSMTPFGLVTSGEDAFVTIAHSDEISVIRDGEILSIVGSGTEHAPCWLTLVGGYVYSANSPSKSISAWKVTRDSLVQAIPVAATTAGSPIDIASSDRGLVAVLDGSSHITQYVVGRKGALIQTAVSETVSGANGLAVVDE
ncbi:MAG: hypothetical protein QOG91_540 [Candidatus Parcubacteria bacterium]|jgi:hypothetical protein|nr:hypothetical protein [Candidatus Parcubacteria bacterium]